jgi:hypothetical protein
VLLRQNAAGQWPLVRKTPLVAPFLIYKMYQFTKTGSGQTYGKLKKRVAFFLGWEGDHGVLCFD